MGFEVFMWTVVVWNAKLFRKYSNYGGNLTVFCLSVSRTVTPVEELYCSIYARLFSPELFSLQQMFRELVCIEACCTSCTGLLFVSDCNRNSKVSINFSKSSECRISWKILGGARVVAERRTDTCSHSKPNWRIFVNCRRRDPEHKSQSPTMYLGITFMKKLHVTIGVLYSLEPY